MVNLMDSNNILWNQSTVKRNNRHRIDDKIASNFIENRVEKYALLMRVSIDMQVEGESLDTQRDLALEVVKESGGILVETYLEEGVSASKNRINNRPSMVKLIQDIKDGKVNHILVYKRDRITRIPEDAKYFYRILREHGCKITLTARGELQIDLDEKEITSSMMESIQFEFAKVESIRTSERVADNMLGMAKQGLWVTGAPPIGYELFKDDNDIPHLKPIESFIPTIRWVEELYLNGIGIKKIARYFNGLDVVGLDTLKTKVEKPKTKRKKSSDLWNETNITQILFNPVYTGYVYYNSLKFNIEPVVVKSPYITPCRDESLQLELNNIRKSKQSNNFNKKKFATPFLLTGQLKCEECGEYYIASTSQIKGGKRHSYYKCKNRNNTVNKKSCKSVIFKKDTIESYVVSYADRILTEFLDSEVYTIVRKKLQSGINVNDSQAEVLKSKIKTHEKKLENVTMEILELDRESLTYQMMKKNYENIQIKLLTEINEYKESLSEIEVKVEETETGEHSFEEFLNLIERYRGIFDVAPINIKKRIIEKLFSEITADTNGQITLKLAFDIKVNDTLEEKSPFISSDTVGEGIVAKDIIGGFINMDYKFNYFDELSIVQNIVTKGFFDYLCALDAKFYDINAYSSEELSEGLGNINQRKISTINSYTEAKLNINAYTRKRLHSKVKLSYEVMEYILKELGLTMENYATYLCEKENININANLIEDSLNTINIRHTNDLTNKLLCGNCGNKFKPISKTINQSYRCIKNRSDIQKRCYSKTIPEISILNYFKYLNVKISELTKIIVLDGQVVSYE